MSETIAGGAFAALAVLGICFLVRPAFVLGRDGQWRQKADPMAFGTEIPPSTASVPNTAPPDTKSF